MIKARRHMDFRVIIAGGRDFADYLLLEDVMDKLLEKKSWTHHIIIISGCAKGADTMGESYAGNNDAYGLELYPADWNKHGRAAGPIRNQKMADHADALVAFWDGKSRGTKSMITIATRDELRVRVINY